jgi:hypothetical protein
LRSPLESAGLGVPPIACFVTRSPLSAATSCCLSRARIWYLASGCLPVRYCRVARLQIEARRNSVWQYHVGGFVTGRCAPRHLTRQPLSPGTSCSAHANTRCGRDQRLWALCTRRDESQIRRSGASDSPRWHGVRCGDLFATIANRHIGASPCSLLGARSRALPARRARIGCGRRVVCSRRSVRPT